MGRISDGRRREVMQIFRRWDFSRMGRGSPISRFRRTNNTPSSIFGARITNNLSCFSIVSIGRTKSPSTFFFVRPLSFFFVRPLSFHSYQSLSALLSSGSSTRSSTLKIRPEIEIGPLFEDRDRRLFVENLFRPIRAPRISSDSSLRRPKVMICVACLLFVADVKNRLELSKR